MGLGQNAINLITLLGLMMAFGTVLYLYVKFKTIKVIKNNKNLSKEEMQVKIEQLDIIQKVYKLSEGRIERLVRLSGNPLNLTPAVFSAIIYILPVIFGAVGIWFLAIDIKELGYLCFLCAGLAAWYPPYHYKCQVKAREWSWFKLQQHLYKISEQLEANDYKKALINVSMYLRSIKEDELANGLSYMVEKWPENEDHITQSLEEFKYYYPFDMPCDLFVLLINAEQSGLSATERINSFKGTCIMKYEKFADKILQGIPAIATCLSLPFLMISCVVALLIPNIIQMMSNF